MAEPAAEPELWLTYQEAAERLGWRLWRLKSRARREGWEVRERNRGGHLVRLPGELAAEPQQSLSNGNGRADDHAVAEPDPDMLEMVAELRERLGRAEGELAAKDALVATLTAALAKAEARAERLAAELAEARRPLLLRLLEAVRRK